MVVREGDESLLTLHEPGRLPMREPFRDLRQGGTEGSEPLQGKVICGHVVRMMPMAEGEGFEPPVV